MTPSTEPCLSSSSPPASVFRVSLSVVVEMASVHQSPISLSFLSSQLNYSFCCPGVQVGPWDQVPMGRGQKLHQLPPGLVIKPSVESPKLSPLLSMGLGVRSYEILEDGGSSWWKGPRALMSCLKEVSWESCSGRDIHAAPSKRLRFVITASITPWRTIFFFFKRGGLVLVLFQSIFWFVRKPLESCYLWQENTFVKSSDNIFRHNVQHSAGWPKRICISSNNQDICIIFNLGKKLV